MFIFFFFFFFLTVWANEIQISHSDSSVMGVEELLAALQPLATKGTELKLTCERRPWKPTVFHDVSVCVVIYIEYFVQNVYQACAYKWNESEDGPDLT